MDFFKFAVASLSLLISGLSASAGCLAAAESVPHSHTLSISPQQRGTMVGELHYGIFLEDINHAADGGLYAELIRNRSFEDDAHDAIHWTLKGGGVLRLETTQLLNDAQQRAARIDVATAGVTLQNAGYWGIDVRQGRRYELTLWVKADDYRGRLTAQLCDSTGHEVLATTPMKMKKGNGWQKLTATLTATGSCPRGVFRLQMDGKGSLVLDMVSLFPPTWKNRPNGMRSDLAQRLADLKPRFMRFPGGCFVEGEELDGRLEQFRWKESVGPIEQRRGFQNTWRYPVTNGLGYHEMLQLCEDLGATPLYVTNVGVWHGGFAPHDSIDWYIQDALDAIEYANGDAKTTRYGALRAKNGHPDPFGLTMIEIGNENNEREIRKQSDHYAERYTQFYNAIHERYPEMKIIGNVAAIGVDDPHWNVGMPTDMVDEHYYRSAEWLIKNNKKYDERSRELPAVYIGEFSDNRDCGNGNLRAALAEAIFLMGTERNADVVKMTSFAPLFKNLNEWRWNPDLIHFNASGNYVTPSYWVQQMCAANVGKYNVKATLDGCDIFYAVQTNDDEGLVVKMVNPIGEPVKMTIETGLKGSLQIVHSRLTSAEEIDENSLREPDAVHPVTETMLSDSGTIEVVISAHPRDVAADGGPWTATPWTDR